MNLLCIDIGNSTVKFGLFQGDSLHLQSADTADRESHRDIIAAFRDRATIHGCIISSVVDEVTPLIGNLVKEKLGIKPVVLNSTTDTGLTIRLDRPELLGPDRIANAVAAYEMYRQNAIVVDFGTATTTTVVTSKAEIIGGHIMPGIKTMLRALSEMTSKLPELKPYKPELPFGKDTKSSIMSGVVYGTAGSVRRFVEEIEKSIGRCNIIITGGLSGIVSEYLDFSYALEPNLTLKGLSFILKRSLG